MLHASRNKHLHSASSRLNGVPRRLTPEEHGFVDCKSQSKRTAAGALIMVSRLVIDPQGVLRDHVHPLQLDCPSSVFSLDFQPVLDGFFGIHDMHNVLRLLQWFLAFVNQGLQKRSLGAKFASRAPFVQSGRVGWGLVGSAGAKSAGQAICELVRSLAGGSDGPPSAMKNANAGSI